MRVGNPALPTRAACSPAHEPPRQRCPMQVLLAEDDVINQQVIIVMLEADGHRVDVANDGREAVDRIAAKRYDIVLMDCEMPVMDGLAATRAIRREEERRNANERMAIVALTGRDSDADRAACRAAGMTGFLAKPVTAGQLAAALATAAGGATEPFAAPAARAAAPPGARDAFDPSLIAAMPMIADGSDPGFAAELVAVFSNRTRRLLADLAAANAAGERDAMIRCVHTMKSSSAMTGALALSDRARDCELRLRGGEALRTGWIDRLNDDFAHFEAAVAAYLATLPANGAPPR
jgi:CheY-like chemotaxis protein/HPt (histidine-containing phosphotransfer) domain-containing protein